MEKVKRLRIIAGPNGSGKTSFYVALSKMGSPHLGTYINADEIEHTLKTKGILSFSEYGLDATEAEVKQCFSSFIHSRGTIVPKDGFFVRDGFLVIADKEHVDSYFASFVAEYLRDKMMSEGLSPITMETVMSHSSKLDLMRAARRKGYRVYLYYIATDNPQINIERVKARTEKGGHDVPEDKLLDRYCRSLDLLHDALLLSDRAFLIDNSAKSNELVAEYDASVNTLTMSAEDCPEWVWRYFFDKER